MAHNFVSAPFSARYVRLSTRLAEKGALSRSASKYRPRSSKLGMAATCFVKAPFRNAVTYERVRSGVAIRAKLQESRLKERLSICLRAIAPFPRKACSLAAPLCGDPDSRGAFAFCIQISPSDFLQLDRAHLNTMVLFRRWNNENFERASLDTTLFCSECNITPGQRGRGRSVQTRMLRLRLNIYACKKLNPVRLCPNVFLFRAYYQTV